MEQGEQIDSQPGFPCGNEIRPAVANVHVIQRDLQAGEQAEPHLAADPDFHPQRIRSCRFEAGFVGIGVHKKEQRHAMMTSRPANPLMVKRMIFCDFDILHDTADVA